MAQEDLESKYRALRRIIGELESVVVAFSGGVDSTLVLKVALDVLGVQNVLAATARSPSFPPHELDGAENLARELGARHRLFDSDEMSNADFSSNPPDRCYFCKRELFTKLAEIAAEEGLKSVAEGSNSDDEGDFRPGLRAAEELGVRSPLRGAGLTKADVRALSRRLALPTHDKPSFACLASRIPYGERITGEKLARIEKAEALLRGMGMRQFRVRSHNGIARIELAQDEDMAALVEPRARARISAELRRLGFSYVTLDLEGYRSGSMNEVLKQGATHSAAGRNGGSKNVH
jgi:uncharacterized protein